MPKQQQQQKYIPFLDDYSFTRRCIEAEEKKLTEPCGRRAAKYSLVSPVRAVFEGTQLHQAGKHLSILITQPTFSIYASMQKSASRG